MAFLGKEYKFVKGENYESFLKALGYNDEKIQQYIPKEMSETTTKNGDTYTIHYKSSEGNMDVNFKPGVEVEEPMDEDITMKSTYTIDGNTINQVMKSKTGVAHAKKEYNGNDLVVTMTCDKWDGVARMIYKA